MSVKNDAIKFLNKNQLLFANHNYNLSKLDLNTGLVSLFMKENISTFSLSSLKDKLSYADGKISKIVQVNNTNRVLSFKGSILSPVKLHAAIGDSLLVEYADGIKIWNLRTLKLKMNEEKFYKKKWMYHHYSSDLSLKFTSYNVLKKNFVQIRKNNYHRIWLKNKDVIKVAFSRDNRKVAILSGNGEFTVYGISFNDSMRFGNEKSILYKKFRPIDAIKFDYISFNKAGDKIMLLGKKSYIFNLNNLKYHIIADNFRKSKKVLPGIFHPYKNEVLLAATFERIDTVPLSKKEGWISIKRKEQGARKMYYENLLTGVVSVWDTDSFKYKSYLYNDMNTKNMLFEVASIIHHKQSKHIYVFYTDNSVMVYSDKLGEVTKYENKYLNCLGVKKAILSHHGKFIFLHLSSGGIKVLDAYSLNELCTLFALENGEFMILNKDNYYKRSKNISNAVALQKGDKMVKLSQFDKFYNRPHLIMDAMGLESEIKINIVKRLVEHDLKNYKNPSFIIDIPTISIQNVHRLALNTLSESIEISVEVEAKNGIKNIQAWVNGVPLFVGEKQLKPKGKKIKWATKINILLVYGKNSIKFKVYDLSGIVSSEEVVEVVCKKEYVKPNLHLIVLSVSDYKSTQYNLKYAVKDGTDFVSAFIDKNGKKRLGFPTRFNKIIVDTLFNSNATKSNFLSLSKKLAKTKPEDYVYVYVSGHGLLDTAFNFWYATYNVDFDNPAKGGLSFNQIENIMSGIPARQRLILMDACHSGEVLKDEIVADVDIELPGGAKGKLVGFKYRGSVVEDIGEEKVNMNEIRQELFSNYSSTTGATVISAAAGNSYALESDEWSNGIFTYSIIAGLTNRLADLNNDGEISVIELSKFVNKEVFEKTNGMQIPNDRQENLENNFRLW